MVSIHMGDPNCPICSNPTVRSYSSVAIGGVVLHCQRCGMSVPLAGLKKWGTTQQEAEF
ncbi:hypothetical protein NIES2135_54190 [Leptolyngbya boryana NIES-2135]|jgi:hypothetical protein|uniref:Uncharacterized protein n=1 Tax=Leptolyngbya boryana NIES-2135 TaxID=1973484 RepID=A0A1Z4JP98_LEPBY|nr:hypothetical protein NIES2135_54190 [Leptolyngbya boryana NIES-2135]